MHLMPRFIWLLVALHIVGYASAAARGWYGGVSAGSASSDASAREFEQLNYFAFSAAGMNVLVLQGSSMDDSDTAWSLFGGYRISRYFSIEAAYVDLGSLTYQQSGSAGRVGGITIPPRPPILSPATSEIALDSSGFSLKGMGMLPLGSHFDVHAQLGIFVSETELDVAGTVPAAGFAFSESVEDDSEDGFYGVGIGYHFARRWALSLDWQRFLDLGVDARYGSEDGVRADRDALTLSLQFGF